MNVELSEKEKEKYDETYTKITKNYSKRELQSLEEDDIAKYYLHTLILNYVLNGKFPSVWDLNHNIHKNIEIKNKAEIEEIHYDAKIPLEEKPVEIEVETITSENEAIISSLNIERTES